MGGRPCIRGLRIPIATVIRMVASGMSVAEIIEDHPSLEEADIRESLEFAAALAAGMPITAACIGAPPSSQLSRITVNPEQCGGRACIRGMRIRVIDVLDLLAAGLTPAQVLSELPDLEPDDITASLQYASHTLGSPSYTK